MSHRFPDMMAAANKQSRTTLAPYPGGVPRPDNAMPRQNQAQGAQTNASIRATVLCNSEDLGVVGTGQVLILDTNRIEKPSVMNLQQVNHWLRSEAHKVFKDDATMSYYLDGGLSNEHAERAYILNRFKVFGIASTTPRDEDADVTAPVRRNTTRALTCTVAGGSHVLDYWSTKTRPVLPFDVCYFVLKKVPAKNLVSYQYAMNSKVASSTLDIPGITESWQIVPENASGKMLPKGILAGNCGAYWVLGRVHEYPDLMHRGMYAGRDDLSVARDINALVMGGKVVPMQFYLDINGPKTY